MHKLWSLSCKPIAKNICPIVAQIESVSSHDLSVRLSMTIARINGGKSDARNLIE